MTTGRMTETLDRRRFLQSAAGTGATLTYAPALFSIAHATEEPDPINIALIGVGGRGQALAATGDALMGGIGARTTVRNLQRGRKCSL